MLVLFFFSVRYYFINFFSANKKNIKIFLSNMYEVEFDWEGKLLKCNGVFQCLLFKIIEF